MPEYTFPDEIIGPQEAELKIFTLRPPMLTYGEIGHLARRFGINATRSELIAQERPAKTTFSQGCLEFNLHRGSGGWRFRDNSKWQVDDGYSNVGLTDVQVAELALKYINEYELADKSECHLLKVSRLNVGVADRIGKYAEERVIDVGVAFQRTVDRLPVAGPGGKIVLYLDHTGTITGVDRIWREIEDLYQPVEQFRPLEYALKDVVNHWGRSGYGRIIVEEVRVGYFELGWEHAQRYLQPAYIMPLTIISNNGRFVMRSEHVIPAAVNGIGTLMPRILQVKEQQLRESAVPGPHAQE